MKAGNNESRKSSITQKKKKKRGWRGEAEKNKE